MTSARVVLARGRARSAPRPLRHCHPLARNCRGLCGGPNRPARRVDRHSTSAMPAEVGHRGGGQDPARKALRASVETDPSNAKKAHLRPRHPVHRGTGPSRLRAREQAAASVRLRNSNTSAGRCPAPGSPATPKPVVLMGATLDPNVVACPSKGAGGCQPVGPPTWQSPGLRRVNDVLRSAQPGQWEGQDRACSELRGAVRAGIA